MKNNVTIAIPVFNEEKNIRKLLRALLAQRTETISIERILVVSDGSTDNTNTEVAAISAVNPSVELVIGEERLGKSERLNQMFKLANTDVVVLLDGDIHIESETLVTELTTPILFEQIDLTSGRANYLPPKTYFEKIMKVGIDMWSEVKESVKNGDMYTCEGQIRAFSKRLYKKIIFPQFSAEDVYPYLYCQKYNFSYKYVPSAVVYYGLPSTISDYIKQHTRYLHSKTIQSKNFAGEIIKASYVIKTGDKLRAYRNHFAKYPLLVILYTLLLIIPKIEVYFETDSIAAKWTIIESTKK
jgi:glycosyltransferase involved in cell wall biosynthesis